MCNHTPRCPDAHERTCCTAHITADHTEQGWCLLCNGIILFDDGLFLSPNGPPDDFNLGAGGSSPCHARGPARPRALGREPGAGGGAQ